MKNWQIIVYFGTPAALFGKAAFILTKNDLLLSVLIGAGVYAVLHALLEIANTVKMK